jgi:hypothetical protein
MHTNAHETAQLGELVVAAFDEAAQYSSDPREVSRLATRAVMHLLRHVWKRSPSCQPQQHTPARTPSKLKALPRPFSSSEVDG